MLVIRKTFFFTFVDFKKLLCAFMVLLTASLSAQVTFIIDDLPNTTPEKDTLYICGTFNNWQVKDKDFMLHKQLDGRYAISMPDTLQFFEYKFTRGSWLKVETNSINEHLSNRIQAKKGPQKVHIQIENWQDLGGVKKFKYISFYFFAIAFNGLALLLLIFRVERRDKNKTRAIIVLSSLIISILLGSVLFDQSNLILQSYLAMICQILLFIWGPYLLIFSKAFVQKTLQKKCLHFLPAVMLTLISLARLLNISWLSFWTKEVTLTINVGAFLISSTGIVFNLIYHFKALQCLSFNRKPFMNIEDELFLPKLTTVLSTGSVFIFMLNLLLLYLNNTWSFLQNFSMVFFGFSLIILIQFYLIWRNPDLLKEKINQIPDLEANPIKSKLEKIMNTDKPYKKADLSVAELSKMLAVKPYLLSKILNEHYKKNFRDFINEYRVEEFIRLAVSENYKNYTFLALAHEVGFNSKSTFNLAFKKIKKISPREYLQLNHQIIKE